MQWPALHLLDDVVDIACLQVLFPFSASNCSFGRKQQGKRGLPNMKDIRFEYALKHKSQ